METTQEVEQVEETPENAQEAPEETTPEPEPDAADADGEDVPDWVKAKLKKANNEAQNLRQRLKEQEPLVAAAQEAERAKMSELERERADKLALQEQLAQRDTALLVERYRIPEEFVEFVGEGSFEEKEARAAKVGQMVQPKDATERPPTERPVGSLKPGASPSTPPVEDHSYPAAWGFAPAVNGKE